MGSCTQKLSTLDYFTTPEECEMLNKIVSSHSSFPQLNPGGSYVKQAVYINIFLSSNYTVTVYMGMAEIVKL